jgi:lysozyme family protein
MEFIPVLTKKQLTNVNDWAIEMGYNRALEPKPLHNHLSKIDEDTKFPIIYSFPHNHAAGKEVEEHVRCEILLDGSGSKAFIDIDVDLFNGLERVELPEELNQD